MRAFVKAVESDVPTFHDFLGGADVEVVRTLRRDSAVSCNRRLVSRPGEFGDGALRDRFQRWRREVTRVTGVQHGPIPWLVNKVEPRAELVFVRERIYEI